MDKETLSNYGWIVICVMVLAVMIALATPFGGYIRDAFNSTVDGLFSTSQNAMNSLGDLVKDPEWLSKNPANSIPSGGVYVVGSTGQTLKGDNGDSFPVVGELDVYTYGDYRYQYSEAYGGWWCTCVDKSLEVYGEIHETISGKPITMLESAFAGCENMKVSPNIPLTVTNIAFAYSGCINLQTAPSLHEGIDNLDNTFKDCKSLTVVPEIPSTAFNMDGTFYGCTSLTGVVRVPCSALVNGTTVPSSCVLETFHTADCEA